MLLSSVDAIALASARKPGAALGARICVARAHNAASNDGPVRFDVHGRHVNVDDRLRHAVISRLTPVLQNMASSQFMEGAGGVSSVDVRLMNTSAEIRVHPVHLDKAHHDTFLRQGELLASSDGTDAWDSFQRAAEQLERKLKPQKKAPPKKVNYRSLGSSSSRSNSTGSGRL